MSGFDFTMVNMSSVLAGQVVSGRSGMYGKKTAWGFDVNEPTPVGYIDVERKADAYAKSRPCITRKATPNELAEVEKILKIKNKFRKIH